MNSTDIIKIKQDLAKQGCECFFIDKQTADQYKENDWDKIIADTERIAWERVREAQAEALKAKEKQNQNDENQKQKK